MICRHCGAELQNTDDFCPRCGKKVQKTAYCPKCGALLHEDAEFCHKCGAKVPAGILQTVLIVGRRDGERKVFAEEVSYRSEEEYAPEDYDEAYDEGEDGEEEYGEGEYEGPGGFFKKLMKRGRSADFEDEDPYEEDGYDEDSCEEEEEIGDDEEEYEEDYDEEEDEEYDDREPGLGSRIAVGIIIGLAFAIVMVGIFAGYLFFSGRGNTAGENTQVTGETQQTEESENSSEAGAAEETSGLDQGKILGKVKVVKGVNIRETDNSKEDNIIRVAKVGEVFEYTEKTSGGWYHILLSNGKSGYVYGDYVTEE